MLGYARRTMSRARVYRLKNKGKKQPVVSLIFKTKIHLKPVWMFGSPHGVLAQ